MEIVLAAAAAGIWGVADFCGGRATRRLSPLAVTFAGQLSTLVPLALLLLVLDDPSPGLRDWLWGVAAGLFGFAGITMLYRALSSGAMTVVAPLTGVIAAVVPMMAGIGFGERPKVLALLGVAAALAGIALVTGAVGTPHARTPTGIVVLAALAGTFIGFSLICLDRTSDASGMWPTMAMRLSSVITIGVILLAMPRPSGLSLRNPPKWAIVAGLLDTSANILFLMATRMGLLSLVSVIASLYPASTIMLAMKVDHERIARSQALGMVLVGVALVLVSLGR